ncbi:uncharacterized protein MELLADRAFT_67752 [Melampsora larici-populina 98AG31]|uniref:Uncharacterized protein n=1 Tax=Melampsora larici-populina (strain 98AG31 / pathotype 3-4-7) TaxID=747676 RepID=F4S454_MELLP|nr:uncharacterized protein MELLADRAFT_67752 [Melampsora larici-populina 98AG31]EGG00566.1 hypothetical protein MELLADRAFT_67752 [Melampsora larici-populina 98AG31]
MSWRLLGIGPGTKAELCPFPPSPWYRHGWISSNSCDWHKAPPGLKVFHRINKILQSGIQEWTNILKEVFMMESQFKEHRFWQFIGDLLPYMPTPAVQVTLMQMETEKRKFGLFGDELGFFQRQNLEDMIVKGKHVMKEHIEQLQQDKVTESDRIINTFTDHEQEKLGRFKINLAKQWSPLETIELWQHWVLYLSTYSNVNNHVKGMRETQVILEGWVKAETRNIFKMASHQLGDPFEDLVTKRILSLKENLINDINSSNNSDTYEFVELQSTLRTGLILTDSFRFTPVSYRTVMSFWVQHLRFYLGIKHSIDPGLHHHPLERLILLNSKHLENMIHQFQKSPTLQNSQNDLLTRFLEFFLDQPQGIRLGKFALHGLERIKILKGLQN